MPVSFVIPSIFTAVDQMSPTVQKMRGNVISFASGTEAAFARTERVVRRLTPGLRDAQKQLLSMVGTGAALAGAFQLGSFSLNALTDYESSVDAFRVIVSDLNDTDFKKFQDEIDRVAIVSKRGGAEVAAAFEQVAAKNAKFAETAEGLGQVSMATITLAKAAKMDLGTAAENLVGIMNQFSFGANQADRAINALAAGQAVGAASITQTAEAFVNLGPTASAANISLEQSIGLIQTLAKFSLVGADAGTALRGSIIKLQKAGLGYQSGQFSINDALKQTNDILAKVKTAKDRDAIVTKIFGIHNITAGKILLSQIPTYNEFTRSVTGTSEAQKGAALMSGNLKTTVSQLSAAWINMLTQSTSVKDGTDSLSDAIKWLTANLSQVVHTGITVVKLFLEYKAVMLAARATALAWNVTLGISSALQGASSIAMAGNTVALSAQRVAMMFLSASTVAATESQWGLNAAMSANPVFLAVGAIAALAVGIGYLAYHQGELNEEYERQQNMNIRAHITAQTEATQALAKQWEKVGYNIHDATIKALQFQVTNAAQGVSKATTKQTEVETQLRIATDEAWFPAFNSEVSRLRNELTTSKGALTVALADKLGSTSAVQNAINSGVVSVKEGRDILQGHPINTEAKKGTLAVPVEQTAQKSFSPEQQALVDEMNATIKASMNATITIKNDSSGTVGLSSGKTQLADVQPKMQSTKVLTPAYGR